MKKIINKKNTQIIIVILLSLVCIVFFIQMLGKANRENGYDFTSYLISSKALLTGNNPYLTNSPFPYIYPLFLASVLTPFTYLPYTINHVIWFILNVSSLCLSIYFLQKQFYNCAEPKGPFLFALFLIVILIINPIQNNLLNGQVNFIVVLFCVLFFYYDDKNILLSSVSLAIAISIKIVPLIFLLYLISEKKYYSILITILFSFLFVFILPYLFAGIKIIEYYKYYSNNFIFSSFSKTGYNTDSLYFSLYDFLIRIFPVLNSLGIYLKLFLAAIIISPVIYLHSIFLKSGISQRKLIIFSLLSLSVLLISPSSETHHLVFLIPSIFLIIINIYEKNINRIRFVFYYVSFFILFWTGSIYKYSPFIFLSLITLFIITITISKNKIRLANEKI